LSGSSPEAPRGAGSRAWRKVCIRSLNQKYHKKLLFQIPDRYPLAQSWRSNPKSEIAQKNSFGCFKSRTGTPSAKLALEYQNTNSAKIVVLVASNPGPVPPSAKLALEYQNTNSAKIVVLVASNPGPIPPSAKLALKYQNTNSAKIVVLVASNPGPAPPSVKLALEYQNTNSAKIVVGAMISLKV